jgi:hypothetical protein
MKPGHLFHYQHSQHASLLQDGHTVHFDHAYVLIFLFHGCLCVPMAVLLLLLFLYIEGGCKRCVGCYRGGPSGNCLWEHMNPCVDMAGKGARSGSQEGRAGGVGFATWKCASS